MQKLRDLLRAWIVSGIARLPDGVLLDIRSGVRMERSMDYQAASILLDVESSDEYHVRRKSCSKEPETIQWIHQHVGPGDVVYDIGANIGAYALVMAAHTKGEAEVYAFEPGFNNYAKLCTNIRLNGFEESVVPLPFALTDGSGILEFSHTDDSPGSASHELGDLLPPTDDEGRDMRAGSICTVGLTLDQAIEVLKLPLPTHLKIDVDGAEVRLLQGAAATLESLNLKTIMIEVDSHEQVSRDVCTCIQASGFVEVKRVKRPIVDNVLFQRK